MISALRCGNRGSRSGIGVAVRVSGIAPGFVFVDSAYRVKHLVGDDNIVLRGLLRDGEGMGPVPTVPSAYPENEPVVCSAPRRSIVQTCVHASALHPILVYCEMPTNEISAPRPVCPARCHQRGIQVADCRSVVRVSLAPDY